MEDEGRSLKIFSYALAALMVIDGILLLYYTFLTPQVILPGRNFAVDSSFVRMIAVSIIGVRLLLRLFLVRRGLRQANGYAVTRSHIYLDAVLLTLALIAFAIGVYNAVRGGDVTDALGSLINMIAYGGYWRAAREI